MVKALRNDMTAFDIAMVLLGEARGWIGIARGGLELEQQDRAKPKKRHR